MSFSISVMRGSGIGLFPYRLVAKAEGINLSAVHVSGKDFIYGEFQSLQDAGGDRIAPAYQSAATVGSFV